MGEGAIYTNWQWYKEAGITYKTKSNSLIELGFRYFDRNEYNSYIDRSNFREVVVSPFSFSIAYKKVFDFTNGYSTERSRRFMKKVYALAEEKGKPVPMNIDGATAVIFAELGFPAPMARGLFCLSRSVGILSHAYEQQQQGGRNKGPTPPGYRWTYAGPNPIKD